MNNWDQFQSTPKLLPPTVFEKTNISSNSNNTNNESNFNNSTNSNNTNALENDSFKHNRGDPQFNEFTSELEKLKLEIKKLHSENDILRHKNRDFVEQAQLFTEASGHRQISISTLEEIIHKQTREIQSLKCDLLNEREKNTSQQKEIELNYAHKLNDALHRLNETENEKRKIIDSNAQAINKLSRDNEAELASKNQQMRLLTDDNKTLLNEIKSLNDEINQLKQSNIKDLELKDLKIKELNDSNSKQLNELQNLKNYINDSMPTMDTVKQMQKESYKFEEQQLKIKQKNDSLQKENQALQTRLKSINEILIIQESQLEQPSATSHLTNEKKRLGLLNKWRTKVFELLIQLKNIEINNKQDKNMNEKTLLEYIERLDTASSNNKILENVIEDKKAEICVLNNDNSRLNDQLSILKDNHDNLEKKSQQDLQSSIELKKFVNSLLKQYQLIETSFKVASKKLTHLDQRVEFAKNRLGVIKALYSNKNSHGEELKRGNVLEMTSYLSSIHGSINPNESNFNHQPLSIEKQLDKDDELLLRQELEKVSEERDLLANKLKNEMEIIDDKVNKMKNDYEFKVTSLNQRVSELNESNSDKEHKMEQINQEMLAKEALNKDLELKYDELQKKYSDLRTQMQIDFEKQIKLRELEFSDKIQQLDENLNEARREQSKAVVIMRQMERSTNREKERLENLLKSCDSYYKSHLEKLQLKLISLEKERNSLITNLRQHGNLPSMTSLDSDDYQLKNNQFSVKDTSTMASNLFSIDNLLDKNYSLQDQTNTNQNNIEVTSFWLDSKQSVEEPTQNYDEEDDEEEFIDKNNNEDLNDSDLNKNAEILSQIRRIMGNLELSDVELDNTDLKQNEYDNDYETEHAVDDEENIFRRRNDSFSN